MRKLHVFGDSFTATHMHIWGTGQGLTYDLVLNDPSLRDWDRDNPQDYKELLAVHMDAEIISDSPYTAVMGASEEWTQRLFVESVNHITSDDIVLIVPTDPLREHLIPLVPTVGNIINLSDQRFVNQLLEKVSPEHHPLVRDQVKAALYYFNTISTDGGKIQSLIISYYARMAYYQHMLDHIGCKYLICPGQADIDYNKQWPRWDPQYNREEVLDWDVGPYSVNIHNPKSKVLGSLKRVSYNELSEIKDADAIMNDDDGWAGFDKRRNHMSRANHKILANKLIDSLVNNVDLDLTTGFDQAFITKDNCNSPDFIIDAEQHNLRFQ
jgi:hypothetical protein